MKLDECYSIENDFYCVMLKYKKVGNKKTGWRSYHPTLAQALQKYVDLKLREDLEIESILVAINKLNEKIEKEFSQRKVHDCCKTAH